MLLVFTIVVSMIFLAVNIHFERRPERQFSFGLKVVVGLFFTPLVVGGLAVIVIPQVLFSYMMIGITKEFFTQNKRLLWSVGLLASALVYVMLLQEEIRELRTAIEACRQFPMESMQDRVPEPRYTDEEGRLTAIQSPMMDRLEREMDLRSNNPRADRLRQYHEEKLERFSKSFGFGVNRGFPNATYRNPTSETSNFPEITWRQGRPADESLGGSQQEISLSPSFEDLHRSQVVDFSDPFDFGYIKDRLHVTGFRPHQFDKAPISPEDWRVERLDLLGLLIHPDPVVYVTDILPQMEELHGAPTRALDAFEEAGLARLHAGDDMYMKETSDGIRMLGAVRNMKQCVACHGGQRGDLLGAFSYVLRK